MPRPRLGIAAGNSLGAEAAARVARDGGNAVDACLASAVMGWVAEPFFASIGGSGFVTVRTPDGTVEVIDGNNAMPHSVPKEPGQGINRVYLDYSDGMYTGIGGGSVGVPGILAAVHRAWERHGKIEWPAILQPAIDSAREGLPFPRTSAYYLSVTWKEIWSAYPEASELFGPGGDPLVEGQAFIQERQAQALELIAEQGPDAFYRGELGNLIVESLAADHGFITLDDLGRYEPLVREPIASESFGWRIESNPPPSVGGALVAHMLAILENAQLQDPTQRLRAFVEAQRSSLDRSDRFFHEPDTIAADIDSDVRGTAPAPPTKGSPETTHASSADADGYVCSVTESNGYGSGIVVHGMMFNNTLGEEELNPLGPHSLRPGSRCHSNMAPTIATGPDRVVGVGSPGATRIVGAVTQALLRMMVDGDELLAAVAAPRAHLDPRPAGETLCFEPGLPGEAIDDCILRPYEEIHMYFGAVQAASVSDDGTVSAAHDPRRSGGSALI
ncbi:MAG: gamma-glutamyltransferase [Actinomycetota bacterium]